MIHKTKKLWSILLSLALIAGLLPGLSPTARAAEETPYIYGVETGDVDRDTHVLTLYLSDDSGCM